MQRLAAVALDEVVLPFSPGSLTLVRESNTDKERQALLNRFRPVMEVNHDFSRQMVSFQANKAEPGLRWIRYREGFSTSLVQHLFKSVGWAEGARILDPFSGIGTTALQASLLGEGTGIELMPVGTAVTRALAALSQMQALELCELQQALLKAFNCRPKEKYRLKHVAITKGAFSTQTETEIACYREFEAKSPESQKEVLRAIALSVLEEASFTRKDGQYLRWDERSGRIKARLDKGVLPSFRAAVEAKFQQLVEDLPRMRVLCIPQNIRLVEGNSLERLPLLPGSYFDGVVTSPPYANRYDYTRTYALELAYCNYSHDQIKELRQALLSATVENRSKVIHLSKMYAGLERSDDFSHVAACVRDCDALTEVLSCLRSAATRGDLSNKNVIGLVENYFIEMAMIIFELARVMKIGGTAFMVNDNVQYAGEEVPVDLILCSFAEDFGFKVEKIWMLPKGKGNASQQMGRYGRREIRKCVYRWRRI